MTSVLPQLAQYRSLSCACSLGSVSGIVPLSLWCRLVEEIGPLFPRKAEVQTAKGSDAADRNGDGGRHARQDSSVEQDSATGHLANLDKLFGLLISHSAPTEPQVTDVTAASTAGVLVGNHQCIRARMLGQPL